MENKKILTLCLVQKHPKILLGMKKRGFGAGRWNGFGGKVQPGETIEQAARREVSEEAGVEIGKMEKFGRVDFEFQGNPEILEVHMFKTDDYSGEPTEGEEMKPEWFDADAIPFEKMWPDDKHWFPLFLAGKKFTGKFLFGKGDAILDMKLEEVSEV